MARALWKGSISFGLVTVPVGLVSATEAREELAFNLLHKKDGSRLKQKRFCEEEDVEVPWSEVVPATQTSRSADSCRPTTVDLHLRRVLLPVEGTRRGVVLLHRERAEHIAAALGGGTDVGRLEPVATLPAPAPVRLPAPSAAAPAPELQLATAGPGIRREVLGWLAIVAGAAVFVSALAIPLADPALLVALVLKVGGGRQILQGADP